MNNRLLNKIKNSEMRKSMGMFTILLLIMVVLWVTTPNFGTMNNLMTVCLSAAVYVVLAMGMTFIMILGCIDLSVGSIVGLAGGMSCLVMIIFQVPLWVGILCGVICGMICGAINGFIVTVMGLMPFIATLAGQWAYRGVFYLLTNGTTVSIRQAVPDEVLRGFVYMGSGRLFGIPVAAYIFVVLAFVLSFLLRRTTFGRNVYAVGSNPEAARMSGINNNLVKFTAYILCGALSGLAGVMLAARMVSVPSNSGDGYEFEAIFATVVGGTSMAGGEGSIRGAVIGAIIVAILRNGLNLNGVNSFWQQIILGILIVIVVYVDTIRTKRNRTAV